MWSQIVWDQVPAGDEEWGEELDEERPGWVVGNLVGPIMMMGLMNKIIHICEILGMENMSKSKDVNDAESPDQE